MQYNFLGFSVSKMMELNLDMKDMAILRYFVDFKETGRMNYEIVEGEKYYWINYSSIEREMPHLGLGKRAIMLRMLKLRDLGILLHYTKKEGGTYSFYNLGTKYNELINTNKYKVIKNKDESNIYENEDRYEEDYEDKFNEDKNRYEKDCGNKFNKDENSFLEVKEENIEGVSAQEKEQYLHKKTVYMENYAQGVQENERKLCTNTHKGCVSKGRTKTNLQNNSSTKETNIKKYIKKEIEEIVEYLNKELGTNYKSTFKGTIKLIDSRLTEGFTAHDFKTVIDKKAKEWTGTEYEQYLTPTTLFGDKFEKYLNQKIVSEKTRYKNNYKTPKLRFNNFTGREYDYEELEKKLLGW